MLKPAKLKFIKETQETNDVNKLQKMLADSYTELTDDEKEVFAATAIDTVILTSKDPAILKKKVLNYPLVALQCELEIDDIPTEFANAIMRSSVAEVPHYALEVAYKDIFKRDSDNNISMISTNINNIPLVYGLTDYEIDNFKMSLDITNENNESIMVKCGDISFTGNTKPKHPIFFPTMQLTQLAAERRLSISNIKIVRGMSTEISKFNIGVNGRIWPTGKIPENFSAKTDCLYNYSIKFKVNAVNPTDKNVCNRIIRIGIEGLIERLDILKEIVVEENITKYEKHEDHIKVTIEETNTIAKMLDRAFFILYPKTSAMYSLLTYSTGKVEITVSGNDSKDTLIKVIDKCMEFYANLLKQV